MTPKQIDKTIVLMPDGKLTPLNRVGLIWFSFIVYKPTHLIPFGFEK